VLTYYHSFIDEGLKFVERQLYLQKAGDDYSKTKKEI